MINGSIFGGLIFGGLIFGILRYVVVSGGQQIDWGQAKANRQNEIIPYITRSKEIMGSSENG